MDEFQSALVRRREDSPFISGLKVVCNVEEGCSFKSSTESAYFRIGWNKAGEPIISDAHRWDHASGAAELEACLSEDRQLSYYIGTSAISIGNWENLRVVEEYDFNSADLSLVNTESVWNIELNCDVFLVLNASRILR
jgi:predicted proteasome-type protease